MVAAVGAVVADERAIAEEQQVGIRVEQGAARVAAKAVDVPSIPSWPMSVCGQQAAVHGMWRGARNAVCLRGMRTELKSLSFLENLDMESAILQDQPA